MLIGKAVFRVCVNSMSIMLSALAAEPGICMEKIGNGILAHVVQYFMFCKDFQYNGHNTD